MTIDSIIATTAPALGMVISLFVLRSWINKPHEKEHKDLTEAVKDIRSDIKNISHQLVEIKIDMARIYVTKEELTDALYPIRKEQAEIKKKVEELMFKIK